MEPKRNFMLTNFEAVEAAAEKLEIIVLRKKATFHYQQLIVGSTYCG